MCEGFGIICVKDQGLYFCEPDNLGDCSHTEILDRLYIHENTNQFLRSFIRMQFSDWTESSLTIDEQDSVPTWFLDVAVEMEGKAIRLLERVTPIWNKFNVFKCAADQKEMDDRDKILDTYLAKLDWDAKNYFLEVDKILIKNTLLTEKNRKIMIDKMSKIDGYVPCKETHNA